MSATIYDNLFSSSPTSLTGQTALVSGSSRGLGLAIAKRLARAGVNVIVIGKTTEANPKLPGTIYDAVHEITAAGGRAICFPCDVRHESDVRAAVEGGAKHFGGIDILINNASALYMLPLENTTVKTFDLLHDVCYRGSYLMMQACLPFLKASPSPHVLTVAPPSDALSMEWINLFSCYTVAKFNMTYLTLMAAHQWKQYAIPCNCVWPRVPIHTVALSKFSYEVVKNSRKPEFFANAVYELLIRRQREITGHCFLDESVMRAAGLSEEELNQYKVDPDSTLIPDFFIKGEEKFFMEHKRD